MNRWLGVGVGQTWERERHHHLFGVSALLLSEPDLTLTLTSVGFSVPLALSGYKSHHNNLRHRTYIKMK